MDFHSSHHFNVLPSILYIGRRFSAKEANCSSFTVAGFIFNLFSKGKESRRSKALQLLSYTLIIILTTQVYAKSKDAGFSAFLIQFAKSMGWFFLLPLVGAIILSKFIVGDNRFMEKILSLVSMVGMQNGGLASGLALQMGKLATVGLAPAIFGPLMNITGSVLANFWLSKPVDEDIKMRKD